jgi:hypothetical protein
MAAYKVGMSPGILLRIEQRTIDSFKTAMQKFLPHYLNYDTQLPKELHY